jgi:glycosyltransferase involved in cell wall biosynthesis
LTGIAADCAAGLPARPIRVVFGINLFDIGGTELNAVRTAERLDRDQIDLSVVCLGRDGPLLERYRRAGIPLHHFPVRGGLFTTQSFAQGLRLARFLRTYRPDVLHAHDIYSNIFCTPWARLAGVPVVISSRRWWQEFPRPGLRIANRFAYLLADWVLANSPAVGRMVCDIDGVPASRVVVVPNFVDPGAFEPVPAAQRADLLRGAGIPADAFVVGCVARLTPVKNHAMLLKALQLGVAAQPDMHLLLVGSGPERERLEELVASLGLKEHVHFAGQQLLDWNVHGAAHVSVLCSRSEGFPNTIVEAMAAGVAVVATAVGGVPDAIRNEITGLLVPPDDWKALAAALIRLCRDAALRHELGERARATAKAEYAAGPVIDRLTQWYRSVAGRVPSDAAGVSR